MAEVGISQDEFKCPVCLDLLKDPVTIPCGHSYCESCITVCWDQEDQMKVYRCPQCRQTVSPRPALVKNTMLAEVVEKLKKRKLADCYAGAGDVQCDICTGRKYKAVKSCLGCLNSYCQNHLEEHESFFKRKRHNLTEATERLQEMICQTHDKLLEVFCRTDQKFICVLCTMDEHKNHDTVSAAAQRTEKQNQLKETQRSFQQRIQQREKDLQQLREAVESHKRFAQTAVEDTERIFTELIRSIERSHSEATQRIRDQEKTAVSRAEGRLERLEQEINDLRRRDAELEQLSHTQDHIHFLQSFQSLSAPPESTDVNDDPFSSLSSFDGVREFVLQLRDKLEDFCKEELKKISDRDANESDLYFDIGLELTLDKFFDEALLFGEIFQNIVHVDGDVASGESHENQPGESPVAESEHSPNSVTERSSSCVSPSEDPDHETFCDPIVSHLQANGDVNECTLSTPIRGHKRLREVYGVCELPSSSRLRTSEDNEQDYEADFDESSLDESDPGPPIEVQPLFNERAISRLSYGMMIECSVTLPDEDTLTPVKEQPAVSATETLSVGGITLSSEDLETLNPGQWLNDNVVHAYLHLLASKSETKVFVFQSFLEQFWRNEDYTHWKYHKVQFQDFHWAFLPVCRFNHWFLIAFNIPERKVCVLDSLKSTSKHDEFLTYWCNFMKTRASLGIETLDGWTLSSIDVAVQTDWSSCGIFLLMNAESLLQNGKPNVSQQKDTGTLRQYIKDKLLQEEAAEGDAEVVPAEDPADRERSSAAERGCGVS
ncbi:probable E3 ubiquitin-protein ligase TRIML1 isoform X2 [Ctenopharyngodon idella]|uniref:probable E3 ubiquitin-protein ligase TRIML1 isoform X2 n=1 Tax=Ctenopharyngodon idella TaxID=7959 RepID=UPI0022318178|nr:probable E3 ubiquitin-protein ligase TRIML1 isoform X2 [Ctenopharyngodon idella]